MRLVETLSTEKVKTGDSFTATLDKPLVVDGPPATAIDEVVRRRGVDLVVVTNRGAGATKMVLLGTVADGVLEAMPSDVMVVRVPGDFRRP